MIINFKINQPQFEKKTFERKLETACSKIVGILRQHNAKRPFIYYVSTCKGRGVRKVSFLLIFSILYIHAYLGGKGDQKV